MLPIWLAACPADDSSTTVSTEGTTVADTCESGYLCDGPGICSLICTPQGWSCQCDSPVTEGGTFDTTTETTESSTTEDTVGPTEEPTTDEPTTDEPTTDEPTTDEPTTDEPTTDELTTEDPTTEDPTTDTGGGNVEYYAFPYFGGLDRLFIRKADYDNNWCTELRLYHPVDVAMWDISTPQNWSVEMASITNSTVGCLEPEMLMGETEFAIDGQGSVAFETEQLCPSELNVDAVLTFDHSMPWSPPMGTLSAMMLPVDGC